MMTSDEAGFAGEAPRRSPWLYWIESMNRMERIAWGQQQFGYVVVCIETNGL
jgi:hypothetical protein